MPTLPFEKAVLTSTNLTDMTPTEYRADAVVTLVDDNLTVWAVVVEIQLGRDPMKRRTWPAYVATLHARLGCPVFLLVLCPSAKVAAWSAAPIVVSEPGLVLTPLVLGPDRVPVVSDPTVARRNPELSVLSALAHGRGADAEPVFDALLAGLANVDHDHAQLYAEVVLRALPAAARTHLEALMSSTTDDLREAFAQRFINRGRAEGEAMALLAVLDARDIEVSDELRERITSCNDNDQLVTWTRRAATATKPGDLFD